MIFNLNRRYKAVANAPAGGSSSAQPSGGQATGVQTGGGVPANNGGRIDQN